MLAHARDVIEVTPRRARQAPSTSRSSRTGARQAGARTNHLCLDFYDLPQIPHRVGEELGGAARYVIREGVCPYCRLVRDEVARSRAPRVRGRRERLLRALRVALAVRAVGRAAPSRGRLRRGHRRAARQRGRDAAQRSSACSAALDGPAVQPGAAHRAASRAGRRDVPLALGDPSATARDRRARAGHGTAGQPGHAGGSRATSCSPRPAAEAIDTGVPAGPRSWDDFGEPLRRRAPDVRVTAPIVAVAPRHSDHCAAPSPNADAAVRAAEALVP